MRSHPTFLDVCSPVFFFFFFFFVGDWDVKQPGITAIAHPASLEVATTHGVFVLQEMENIVQTYRKSEDQ